ncbi:MAG: anthranilate synthase component I [Candidatus Omnitrophica bacterium]|jgi:anthranilate synthase component 1|nr:anthranilate synthase component I [Candidatus Omnitrophota bacterium]
MYKPDFKEFLTLSKQGNLIPVYKEINADLETPVSAFLKIKKGDYAFLLESVEGKEKIARYSFLGTNPEVIFKSKGNKIEITYAHRHKVERFIASGNPLDEVKKIMCSFKSVQVAGLPRFSGGLVGYIGYDTVRFFEKLPDKNKDHLKLDDILLMLTDTILIFDHFKHTIQIVSNVNIAQGANLAIKKELYQKALKKIDLIQKDFDCAIKETNSRNFNKNIHVQSNITKAEFVAMVKAAKEYIKKGDVIQVVLSQRFKVNTKRDAFDIYRSLRRLNPSPYMYFLKLKDFSVVGSSPEMLVRCEDGIMQTRPIAGTRPRSNDPLKDQKFEIELLKDIKERAEHLMLVDLGRNDLGRVSLTGKVSVPDFMRVERYSHVMHMVSEVRGVLDKKRFDIYDVLKAVFPAGTVSGAPKVRAMEIIDQLENLRRSLYAGAVGYFSFSHNMDTCINIRTIVVKDGFAYIQAGAGIVADSVPAKEYQETVNKAKALIEAIRK